MWYMYILYCSDQTLYVGSTNNLKQRLYAHNNLKSAAHYTKIRRPVTLAYSEIFSTRTQALQREYEIKKLSKQKKILLIQNT